MAKQFNHALTSLENVVKELAESGQSRLPTVGSLAITIGVSPVTLCKAIAVLKRRGTLAAAPRRGIEILRNAVGSTQELEAFRRQAEGAGTGMRKKTGVRNRVRMDLLTSELAVDDMLPTLKELCGKYGVCFATMRSVLDELESEGAVIRHKKGFRLRPLGFGRAVARLAVFARTGSVADLARYTPRSAEFWRLLERECGKKGISIEVRSFDQGARELAGNLAGDPAFRGPLANALGYIVLINDADFSSLHTLLASLQRIGRPVSVVDEIGRTIIPSAVLASPLMRLFVISASVSCGLQVGEYLARLGHRRCGYFGAFIDESWSKNRWQGIKEAFESAGISSGAVLLARPMFEKWYETYHAQKDNPDFDAINFHLQAIQKQVNSATTRGDRAFYIWSLPFLWDLRLEAIMEPLFERALKDRAITAWVTENDYIGLLALEFLRLRGVRVPDEISIVGFDDIIEAFGAGLTSFNFNVPALVNAALNHILSVRPGARFHNAGPLEMAGTIMERASTAPPKNASALTHV
jgi:DNA-binding transcriptional regulator YhcF (GntR family)